MVEIKKEGIILQKTASGFENEGVLNPAAIMVAGTIHLFYRAVSKGNHSSIGYCQLDAPLMVRNRSETPVLYPQFPYESHGMEDPRIVRIDDLYYLTYTAFDGLNALGALATSTDLVHFEKHGVIVPCINFKEFHRLASSKVELNEKYERYNDHVRILGKEAEKLLLWDKNVIFFPRRILGKLHFLHRIKPDIQIACVDQVSDLTVEFWQEYFLHLDESIVLSPKYPHEISYIGGGCPPIETAAGWLLIYHAVHDTFDGYVYTACAALLDIDHPERELSRLPYPLFGPEQEWELKGEVNNVCFPTGAIVLDETLYIYYGAADEQIACASTNLAALLHELLINTPSNEN